NQNTKMEQNTYWLNVTNLGGVLKKNSKTAFNIYLELSGSNSEFQTRAK
ncbi:31563_t:CDS:1, partial [Gigaspora margarita]